MKDNLARRSIESVGWNSVAQVIVVLASIVRSILLARWLPVDVFGVYAGADAVIGITIVLSHFGIGAAFIHRSPETSDEKQAADVLFTLKLIFTALWITLLIAGALIFTNGIQRSTLIILVIVRGLSVLFAVSSVILIRRVVHRRIAVIQVVDGLLKTVVALGLAWNGWGIGALIATDLVSFTVYILGMYAWRPVWKPRLGWDRTIVRYYYRFGVRNGLATALVPALDKIDDLWSAIYLGATATGYYSRAYAFATYPRLVLARPISLVTGGTFAELKGDHLRMSKAFFRSNALLVRSGFLLAGGLVLVAPEFVLIVLGEKWLPMVTAFQLMLLFALLEPLKQNVSNLFLAIGEPTVVVKVRLAQLLVLVIALYSLGPSFGIEGVAVSADIMLLVGIVSFLYLAKRVVDFSLRILFLVPAVALASGFLAAYYVQQMIAVAIPWQIGTIKIAVFLSIYSFILFIFERRRSWQMLLAIGRQWRR